MTPMKTNPNEPTPQPGQAQHTLETFEDFITELEQMNQEQCTCYSDAEGVCSYCSSQTRLTAIAQRAFASAPDLAARVAELEAVLEFYANPEIYRPHPHGPTFDRRDLSYSARAALGKGGAA
jgi:hypothetical protein